MVQLSPEREKRLRQRAAAIGKDAEAYAEHLLSRELDVPLSLLEAAEPFADAISSAGVGEDELKDILTHARDQARKSSKTEIK
jgi:hypothetical protein